jgi:hypothetical protein
MELLARGRPALCEMLLTAVTAGGGREGAAVELLRALCRDLVEVVGQRPSAVDEVAGCATSAMREYLSNLDIQLSGLRILQELGTCGPQVGDAVTQTMLAHPEEVEVQRLGLSILCSSFWPHMMERTVDAVLGALRAYPFDAEVQRVGVRAVRALSLDCGTITGTLAAAGASALVTRAMRQSEADLELQLDGIDCVYIMALDDPPTADPGDTIATVAAAMAAHPEDEVLWAHGVSALRQLSRGHAADALPLVRLVRAYLQGGIAIVGASERILEDVGVTHVALFRSIVDIMAPHCVFPEDALVDVMDTFAMYVGGLRHNDVDEVVVTQLGELGAAEATLYAMRSRPDDGGVQSAGCRTIMRLVDCPRIAARLGGSDVANVLARAVASSRVAAAPGCERVLRAVNHILHHHPALRASLEAAGIAGAIVDTATCGWGGEFEWEDAATLLAEDDDDVGRQIAFGLADAARDPYVRGQELDDVLWRIYSLEDVLDFAGSGVEDVLVAHMLDGVTSAWDTVRNLIAERSPDIHVATDAVARAVVACMRAAPGDASLQHRAVEILSRLADVSAQLVGGAGDALVDAMREHPFDSELQLRGLALIRAITLDHNLWEGAAAAIVRAMRSHPFSMDIQQAGTGLINDLCRADPGNAAALREEGAVEAITKAFMSVDIVAVAMVGLVGVGGGLVSGGLVSMPE